MNAVSRVVMISVMWAVAAPAATYYVSPAGSDGADGLATNRPWRTVSRVNGAALTPGDTVLFERGGGWRESLEPGASGTPGAPVVFGAYGEGPKPVFLGGEIVANASFSPVSGTTYQAAFAGEATSVLADQAFLFGGTPIAAISSLAAVQARSNSWYWTAGTLYVNTGGPDPRTDGRAYTAIVRHNLILARNGSNVVFRGLAVDGSARYNAGYGVRVDGSVNVLLEDVDALRCGKHHFGVINSTGFVGRRLYAAHAMPAQGGGGATAFVPYSDYHYENTTSEWLDSTVEHMEDTWSGGVYPCFYTHGEGVGTVLVSNLVTRGAGFSTSGNEVTLLDSYFDDAGLAVYGHRGVYRGVRLRGPSSKINVRGTGNVFENCVIDDCGAANSYSAAVVLNGAAVSNVFRYCTIRIAEGVSGKACVALGVDASHTSWYANILEGNTYVFRRFYTAMAPGDLDFVDVNRYGPGAAFRDDAGTYTLAQWQGMGFDAGSTEGDPGFADAAGGDFRLAADSACIDAVSAGYVPGTDHDGVARPLDGDDNGTALADLGAHEYAHPLVDADGDGMTDADEVTADTNARDASSLLIVTDARGGTDGFRVRWAGGRRARQVLESREDLGTPGGWTPVLTNEPPTAVVTEVLDTRPGAFRAYRVRAEETQVPR